MNLPEKKAAVFRAVLKLLAGPSAGRFEGF